MKKSYQLFDETEAKVNEVNDVLRKINTSNTFCVSFEYNEQVKIYDDHTEQFIHSKRNLTSWFDKTIQVYLDAGIILDNKKENSRKYYTRTGDDNWGLTYYFFYNGSWYFEDFYYLPQKERSRFSYKIFDQNLIRNLENGTV